MALTLQAFLACGVGIGHLDLGPEPRFNDFFVSPFEELRFNADTSCVEVLNFLIKKRTLRKARIIG